MQIMAGLAPEQTDHLVAAAHAAGGIDPGRRRVVGPYQTVLMVLMVLVYLRHNTSQALIAELFGCSQPTVSRWIGRLAPLITTVLTPAAKHREQRELRSTVRVDGFLAPAGDRRENTYTAGMYSGKRHAADSTSRLSAPHTANSSWSAIHSQAKMHDARAWQESGPAQRFRGRLHADGGPGGFADTAYNATGLTTRSLWQRTLDPTWLNRPVRHAPQTVESGASQRILLPHTTKSNDQR